MGKEEILNIFNELGVIRKGHFLLTSGNHSDTYLQCARIFQNPVYSELFCKELALEFYNETIDLVIGPAIGGIIMAYEVSRQLGVTNCFAERENNIMNLRRGFEIKKGQRILIVEDVVTTGGSVKDVIELVKRLDGVVVGVGSIVDRSGGMVNFGVTFKSLIKIDVLKYDKEECPLCQKGIPLVKPGSRIFTE